MHTLDDLLKRLDSCIDPLLERGIAEDLGSLERADPGDNQEYSFRLRSESMAFTFVENCQNSITRSETYYGPVAVLKDENGQWFEAPSIGLVTREMLDYWIARAATVVHPLLKVRYADLVWDLTQPASQMRPAVTFAYATIDATVDLVRKRLCKSDESIITKLERALRIALSIGDQTRLQSVVR